MAEFEIIRPRLEQVGPLTVRRALPSAQRMMIGPFIFMDHGGPSELIYEEAQGVPEHPHAGLATFTYLLAGTMLHRDSAGHSARIEAGDIALMTAGSGITHDEQPDREISPTRHIVSFLQMWLALPDDVEDMAPAFEIHKVGELPTIDFLGASARLLIGSAWGTHAPTTTYCNTLFADLICSPMGSANLPEDIEERAIYLLEGDAQIADRDIEPRTLVVLQGKHTDQISSVSGCRVIILGGARFSSPRVVAGSFVGSSRAKVRAWQDAYDRGNFPRIGTDNRAKGTPDRV